MRRTGLTALAAVVLASGCGGEDRAAAPEPTIAPRGPIPPALRTVESAAEDTIDFALAGQRAKVERGARTLKRAAHGAAAEELRAAGVSADRIAEFRARSDAVARLAPGAPLLRVALASNRAFGMVPGFFALYKSPVPAAVTTLDYLDFEAKLRAKAADPAAVRRAVAGLDATWTRLRPGFVRAGGTRVAPSFDAHVAAMRRLASEEDALPRAQAEAQHGLDLVDKLEDVYARR